MSISAWHSGKYISVNALFFSDQEPPYSMITLHEMAETGKDKMGRHISCFQMYTRIFLEDEFIEHV